MSEQNDHPSLSVSGIAHLGHSRKLTHRRRPFAINEDQHREQRIAQIQSALKIMPWAPLSCRPGSLSAKGPTVIT